MFRCKIIRSFLYRLQHPLVPFGVTFHRKLNFILSLPLHSISMSKDFLLQNQSLFFFMFWGQHPCTYKSDNFRFDCFDLFVFWRSVGYFDMVLLVLLFILYSSLLNLGKPYIFLKLKVNSSYSSVIFKLVSIFTGLSVKLTLSQNSYRTSTFRLSSSWSIPR